MDWEKYVGLIDTLDLKCCDLRHLGSVRFDEHKVIQIDNIMFGKLGYFTDKFYKNLIKTSQYMIQNFVNIGLELSDIEIIMNKQKVTYRYKFNNPPIKRCIKLQEEYENKKILNMETKVLIKQEYILVFTQSNGVELYIDISYIDNDLSDPINYILDSILDFNMIARVIHEIEERMKQNKDKLKGFNKESRLEINRALEKFKNIEGFIRNIDNRENIEYLTCKYNYTKVIYKSNNDQIDITYKDGKSIILEQTDAYENRVQLSRHAINGLEKIGLGFKEDKGAWRLI